MDILRHGWQKEENLAHLGEVLGMELGFEGREVNVGSFRADILCKNEDDSWVLIEKSVGKNKTTIISVRF